MIHIRCDCGAAYQAAEDHVGRSLRCRGCGRILQIVAVAVPAPGQPAQTPTPDRSVAASRGNRQVKKTLALLGATAIVGISLWAASVSPPARGPDAVQPTMKQPVDPQGAPAPAPALTPLPPSCDLALRPRSSAELGGDARGGLGSLTVSNGTECDAVAVLVESTSERAVRAIFIRGRESGIITQVPAADYRLRFQLGRKWQRDRSFCEIASTSEFDRELRFEETEVGREINFARFEVTLHPVPTGDARKHTIPLSAFELPPP